ncbi:hypothetical protein [Streptomyces sp. CC208A]|uniref:hypothetical protein n=1 Tax=Streptomyces sp. CC208A TaxID=3044573 RepID=UPI0024A9F57C|nr:hypothetical protein [Streptomyces sp. CC208A]
MADPITPTHIIPASAALPPRPPGPDDIPPWRTPPAPPTPPAVPTPPPPQPGPIEVHVTLAPAEGPPAPPEPSRWATAWTQLTTIAPVWKLAAAFLAALLPIPGVGYSLAGVWAWCVGDARETFGPQYGYGLATVPFLLAVRALRRTPALRYLTATVIGLIGLVFGALDLFDVVTITTGVTR